MTEENTQKSLSWDEALQSNGGAFIKFEPGARKEIAIKNWDIVSVEKKDYDDPSKLVMQPEFQADVVLEDGEEVEKRLGMLSKRFMVAVRPFAEGKDTSKPLYLSVKRIGEGNGTNYDVENWDPGQ